MTPQILTLCFLNISMYDLCLFQTHDSKEHLAMMERVLGPIPTQMLQKTRQVFTLLREHSLLALVHDVCQCFNVFVVFLQET